jgi:hypothetical protein
MHRSTVQHTSLSTAIRHAMEQTIPRGYDRKSELPPRFSITLRYYIAKKINFHRHLKKKRKDCF